MIGFIVHDGERACAVELAGEAEAVLRAFVQAHTKLAAAMESLAARAAEDLTGGNGEPAA
jgi:hypothetical protein